MLNLIQRKTSNQVNSQKLRLKRPGQFRPARDFCPVTDAELPIAVYRRGSHQISDLGKPGYVGLYTRRQTRTHIVEQSHAAISPRQNQFTALESTRLLAGGAKSESGYVFIRRYSIVQHERRIPGFCDYAVGTLVIVQRIGKSNQTVAPLGATC